MIDGKVNPAIFAAQKKGILFDVGHGGGSFVWRTAVQAFKEGVLPGHHLDRHAHQQHERRHEGHAERDEQVPGARDAARPGDRQVDVGAGEGDQAGGSWGTCRSGAVADVAVLRLEKGRFGFLDQDGARLSGTQKLTAEVTIRDGKVVYDLNGLASPEWTRALPRAAAR